MTKGIRFKVEKKWSSVTYALYFGVLFSKVNLWEGYAGGPKRNGPPEESEVKTRGPGQSSKGPAP